jgi:hypothetical protein
MRGDVVLTREGLRRVTFDNGDGSEVAQAYVFACAMGRPIPSGLSITVRRVAARWRVAPGEPAAGDVVCMDATDPNSPAYYVQDVRRGWLSLRHWQLPETYCAKVDRVTRRYELVEGDATAMRGPLRGPVLPSVFDAAWNSAAEAHTNSVLRPFAGLDRAALRRIAKDRRHIDVSPDDPHFGLDDDDDV